jgi:hypothetical protein
MANQEMTCQTEHMAGELQARGLPVPVGPREIGRAFFEHLKTRVPPNLFCVHDRWRNHKSRTWKPGDFIEFRSSPGGSFATATLVEVVDYETAPKRKPGFAGRCPHHLVLEDVTILA